MFSRKSPQQPDNVLSHWYVPLDGMRFSTVEFYESVERALAERRVPRLKRKLVEYYEGSRISDKRLYLRLSRERFSFELCAAPFGTSYFFSLRLVEIPRDRWCLLLLIVLAIANAAIGTVALVSYVTYSATGWFWIDSGLVALAVMLGSILFESRKEATRTAAIARGAPDEIPEPPDIETFVLKLPLVGAWYERMRKDTYYRHDTRLMYFNLVSEVVKKQVDEITAANGVKLLRTYDYNPLLTDFYKVTSVKPGHREDNPPPHGAD